MSIARSVEISVNWKSAFATGGSTTCRRACAPSATGSTSTTAAS